MHILLNLLVGCSFFASEPPTDRPTVPPDIPWSGTAPRPAGAPYTMDLAVVGPRAEAEGWAADPTQPDLSGRWNQVQAMPDGLRAVVDLNRQRRGVGLYDTLTVMVLEVNGEAVLRADFTTWEAINGDRVCAWIRHTDVSFKEGMEDQLAPIAETLAPAVLNESPCSKLVAVDADQIVGLYDDGSTYHERRID